MELYFEGLNFPQTYSTLKWLSACIAAIAETMSVDLDSIVAETAGLAGARDIF